MSAPPGPNLSQYFSSTTDSFFEGIAQASQNAPSNTEAFDLILDPNDVPSATDCVLQLAASIPDDVKDLWEPAPAGEPGRPPALTMPGVQLADDLVDPVRQAVEPLLGNAEAQRRHVLSASEVTQDERGLRQLIERGCYRSAVDLTRRLLTIHGQGFGRTGQPAKHSPHSLQLWFVRFALLTKLGLYELCTAEAEAFGQLNRSDVYFECSRDMYATRRGSMAPFSLRLLLAELPMYVAGRVKQALDRLTEVFLCCRRIAEHFESAADADALAFWRWRETRVVHSLINCALQMRDYNMTDTLIAQLADRPGLAAAEKKALYSAWGRIYLQCGDVFGAERKFSESRRIRDKSNASELRDIIDKGLIAVAQNDFQKAQTTFENALKLEPQNAMLANNIGVCSLYSGRLKDAIAHFEQAIRLAGQRNALNDGLLLNLSTLYELESSEDVNKKHALLRTINVMPADVNVNLEFCLKLQTR